MYSLTLEILKYIGTFVSNISDYNILNKKFNKISKKELYRRIYQQKIPPVLVDKLKIISKCDIYYNQYKLLSPIGIYKIFSTNSHHHLFIRLDTFQSYVPIDSFILDTQLYLMYEPALLSINGLLIPGKIWFERFIW